MTYSRSRTRRFLLQSLYARAIGGDVLHPEDAFFEESDKIDPTYAALLEKAIFLNQGKILGTIYEYAPKYDVKTLALINAIILMICLAEILLVRPTDVPEKVSVNEAIELAKRYSDDAGKNLINGILNTILANQSTILAGWEKRKPIDYQCIPTTKS